MTGLDQAMSRCVAFAVEHVAQGGLPFVGQVVDGAEYASAFGVNRVRELADPSAHAEIVAIRDARAAGHRLDGMTLLATGEPCGMCYRFADHHGIAQVFYAVSADEAVAHGFDYRDSYTILGAGPSSLRRTARVLPVDNALTPFHRFTRFHEGELS